MQQITLESVFRYRLRFTCCYKCFEAFFDWSICKILFFNWSTKYFEAHV